jgi:ABC-type uncharacterized transport system substrate-binding protein
MQQDSPCRTASAQIRRALATTASAAALLFTCAAAPAVAHPHVWVEVQATVLIENGAISGIEQRWTFDEFYSMQAGDGLDKNNDGKLDHEELAELAQVNMEGLKEFDYFTEVRQAGRFIDFETPKDVILEQVAVTEAPGPAAGGPVSNDLSPTVGLGGKAAATGTKVLALTFTLPFKQKIAADAEGFQFTIDDPSLFIWLEFAKKDGVKLSAHAPKGCKIQMGQAEQSAEQKRLSDAFGSVGMAPQDQENLKTVRLQCPKG